MLQKIIFLHRIQERTLQNLVQKHVTTFQKQNFTLTQSDTRAFILLSLQLQGIQICFQPKINQFDVF